MSSKSSDTTPAALLVVHFAQVRDRRRGAVVYPLGQLLALTLVGVLCDVDEVEDLPAFGRAHLPWFQQHFGFGATIPAASTLRRAFAKLDPRTLEAAFTTWMQALAAALRAQAGDPTPEVFAVDGKSLKGAVDAASRSTPLHFLHVYATRARVLLAACALPRGAAGESPATVAVLPLLQLAHAIVTVDANGCTAPVARAVRAGRGHYVQHLKANRGRQYDAVVARFAALADTPVAVAAARTATQTSRGHGRDETRALTVVPCRDVPHGRGTWPGLRSVVRVVRTRTVAGRTSTETHYYLTSLPPHPRRLLRAIRDHWRVENNVHWQLDVVFHEDRLRTRAGDSAATFGLVRRIAFNLLQRDDSRPDSLRRKRKIAAWEPAYRLHLLSLGIPSK